MDRASSVITLNPLEYFENADAGWPGNSHPLPLSAMLCVRIQLRHCRRRGLGPNRGVKTSRRGQAPQESPQGGST